MKDDDIELLLLFDDSTRKYVVMPRCFAVVLLIEEGQEGEATTPEAGGAAEKGRPFR